MDTNSLHVFGELSECQNIHEIDNEETLYAALIEAAKEANATILGFKSHKFEPQGISGILFLAESHISVHVYPENNYVSFDAMTCGKNTKPKKALEYFAKIVGSKYHRYTFIQRGIPVGNNRYSFSSGSLSDTISLFFEKLLNKLFVLKSKADT